MAKSRIEWTEEVWNPIRGCSRVSEGCRNCYAERIAARFNKPGGLAVGGGQYPAQAFHGLATMTPQGPRWTGKIRFASELIDAPLGWERPRRVFVNSMSDLFHDDVKIAWLDQIFAVMVLAREHTFQILTKRPRRMRDYLSSPATPERIRLALEGFLQKGDSAYELRWPIENIWVGASVEDQSAADERIPFLLDAPAAVRWISAEPLLGPLDLERYLLALRHEGRHACRGVHWVVAGGESGPAARPMHPDWARALRGQCKVAGVPFFFKQWGAWAPMVFGQPENRRYGEFHGDRFFESCLCSAGLSEAMKMLGKRAAGRKLDGREWDEYPNLQPVCR